MKTFKDLEFKPHKYGLGVQAVMDFENGYGVSVVRFKDALGPLIGTFGSHTNNEKEWELAVLEGPSLTYSTPITDDVMGHLSEKQVTGVMKKVQKLPKVEND